MKKKKFKKIAKSLVVAAYRCLTHLIPVKKGLVVFDSFMGKSYSGSVRAVYERMAAGKPPKGYEPVWVFTRAALRKGLSESPSCRIVTYGTIGYYILMSRASVWVFDTRHEGYLVKKKKQHYMQTWHGTPLKKLGVDIETFSMKAEKGISAKAAGVANDEEALAVYKEKVAAESSKWDVLLSASPFTTETFRRCFSYKGEVLECGYPRNDVLFDTDGPGEDDINGIREGSAGNDDGSAGEEKKVAEKKTILYAPTWRDDDYSGSGGWYGYDPELNIEALQEALGDKYTLTVKLHYLVKCRKDSFPKKCIESGFLRIADSSEDMAGLLKKTDILITDYSSVMFDFALLDRPMFFFTYDLERYRDELRGWYFDFEKEAPGPLARDTKTLISDILAQNDDREEKSKWQEKRRAFKERFAAFENGHAAESAVRKIISWFGQK